MDLNIKRRILAAALALPTGSCFSLFLTCLTSGGLLNKAVSDFGFVGLFGFYLLSLLVLFTPPAINSIFYFEQSPEMINSIKNFDESGLASKVNIVAVVVVYSISVAALFQLLAFLLFKFIDASHLVRLDGVTLFLVSMALFFGKFEEYLKYLWFEKKTEAV